MCCARAGLVESGLGGGAVQQDVEHGGPALLAAVRDLGVPQLRAAADPEPLLPFFRLAWRHAASADYVVGGRRLGVAGW